MIDAWRCDACHALMYHVVWYEGKIYPVEGAPSPHYISKLYPRACSLCFALYHVVVENTYLAAIQTDWEKNHPLKKVLGAPPPSPSGWEPV